MKSTLSRELTQRYAGLFVQLIVKARGTVRTIDTEVSVVEMHIRSFIRINEAMHISIH